MPVRIAKDMSTKKILNVSSLFCVQVTFKFTRESRMADCLRLYNVLFNRIMKVLQFVSFGKKQFDPTAPKIIPQHKLEIWPGYVTAVDEYEDGVMLCVDVSHRVLCQRTCYDLLTHALQSDRINYHKNAQAAMFGSVVLTRYNNKTYRIDDIDFESSPMNTFSANGKVTTYYDYYLQHHNIQIQDRNQPLLVHNEVRKVRRGTGRIGDAVNGGGAVQEEQVIFCLIPELCYLTGLTDEMRSDFKVMRDIAQITRVTPQQRVDSLRKFCQNIQESEVASSMLAGWGIRLPSPANGEDVLLRLQARQLPDENVTFKDRTVSAGPTAQFDKYITNTAVLEAISLRNWLLVYVRQDRKQADELIDCMQRNSAPMGIHVERPIVHVLDTDRTELYVQALRKHVRADLQIVVLLCPTSRDDRYAAIKKVCCSEMPIPSQVNKHCIVLGWLNE